ncbi:MAG: FG-GAP-like repeat-containing protein [Sphingobacteriaceae bacterium]
MIVISFVIITVNSYGQHNAGIFYTSILAKEAPYKRVSGFGQNGADYFLKDVNGDGKDDAVVYFNSGKWHTAISDGINFSDPREYFSFAAGNSLLKKNLKPLMGDVNGDQKQDAVLFDPDSGNWYVAISRGTAFIQPVLWTAINAIGSTKQFLADVNGDGLDDAVLYFDNGPNSGWYIGLSDGKGKFNAFSPWIYGFGNMTDKHYVGDVNGDGKADAIYCDTKVGNWRIAVSNGHKFTDAGIWKTGFGIGAEKSFVYDVDLDGKDDIAYYKNAEWWVCYATGSAFDATLNHRWVTGNRPATMVSRSNLPAPEGKLIGNISGKATGAAAISAGDWLILENNDKQTTVKAPLVDTWDAWGNPYIPQLVGHNGTYDAGDPVINDLQIKMIHDAGFTYIMMDITNGSNAWVDNRAKAFIKRIVKWNAHLLLNQHKMYFCISMGGARGMKGQDAANAIEAESKRTLDEFYIPYKNAYYIMDDKPLLIHFVWQPENSDEIKMFASSMPSYQQFNVRWMYNEIKDQPAYANAYGWPVLTGKSNPAGMEVMNVSPGFWNGTIGANRRQGDVYREQWLRVLQNNPKSVWLNSFNETWEHTSVEPAYLQPHALTGNNLLETWTDDYGNRMDDFYWVMTKQYNRLYMYKELFKNSYLQEDQSSDIYVVKDNSIKGYGTVKPRMAPVLLVPKGFLKHYKGSIINDSLRIIGAVVLNGGGYDLL